MATTTTTECLASANDLLASHSALISRVKSTQLARRRRLHSLSSPPETLLRLPLIHSPPPSRSPSPPQNDNELLQPKPQRPDLPPAKRARLVRYDNYVPEEETIRNDYSQRYVDGGEWPQNWVIGAEPERRFEEYPKQQRLLALKKASVNSHYIPASYLPYSSLSSLLQPTPSKFDVILIDPPFSSVFTWDLLQELPIPSLAAEPSYVFLWVGSGAGDGLERGRETLAKWGYRRCEDIVWVKTNKKCNQGPGTDPPTTSLLTRTKQHCLMGIRGTVRRSTDSWFVHCNVDTDVIIWEGDPTDPTLKPPEMYTLIENFCLGTRRLEVFGCARKGRGLRRGWVTVLSEGEEKNLDLGVGESEQGGEDEGENKTGVDGIGLTGAGDGQEQGQEGATRWEREPWEAKVKEMACGGKFVVPMTPEIEALRPKSPVRGGHPNSHGHGNPTSNSNYNIMGGGVGLGLPMGMGMNMNQSSTPMGGAAMRMGPRGVVGGAQFGFGARAPGQGQGQGQGQQQQQMGMGVWNGMNGNNGNVGMNNMNMVGMGMNGMGLGMQQQGMGQRMGIPMGNMVGFQQGFPHVGGGGGFEGMGMGGAGMEYMNAGNFGQWQEGMGMADMGMNGVNMGMAGMNGLGMNGMNGMTMNGMGMGGMGDGSGMMGNPNMGMGAMGNMGWGTGWEG